MDSILILLFLAYFIVGADLSKEIAKGEFVFFACILTETQTIDSFTILDLLIVDPPIIGVIGEINFIPLVDEVVELYRGRAPPIFPLYI